MRDLRKHDSHSFEKLSVHFLFQNRECSESKFSNEQEIENTVCGQRDYGLSGYEKMKRMAAYPVNEARNLARNVTFPFHWI